MPGTAVLSERIDTAMSVLALSPAELASALRAQETDVLAWLANCDYPSAEIDARIEALLRLGRRLLNTFDSPETAQAWLRSKSAYLGGGQPLDALLCGDIEAVNSVLDALDAGIFV